ncbi:LacI family DNA-binding transcriptional regulator [Mesotoga sp. Brook.08.105.5.1]|uniref:LacI family DNA-binding transcriptional regulator n=1 Tax=Mesotoga sp. Brook.08.105.5.1 TaxID=1421002 RepID=UPI00243453F2|nr:LacI family DNA-binding transcriptional regulator [Mesotoga sp. Brook.08.105.5.1]
MSEITGVAISTVSRVLNNDSRISEATKKKVLRVAKKLGYPGEISSGRGSKVVMFFVSNPHKSIESDEFFSGVQRGILRGAGSSDIHCLVQSIRSKKSFDESLIPLDLVEGLIVGGIPMPDDLKTFLSAMKIPVVLIGKYSGLENLASVNNDNVRGGYLAANEIIKYNYSTVTVITGPRNVSTFADRLEGFFKCLSENRFPTERVKIIECNSFEERDGRMAIERHLRTPGNREVIFCTTDWLAKGVIEALQDRKVSIPSEIGVIGFGGLDFCKMTSPKITTVALNPYLLGRIAVTMLQELMEGNAESKGVVFVEPFLMEGETLRGEK